MATQRKWIERIAESLEAYVESIDPVDLIEGLERDENGCLLYKGEKQSRSEAKRIDLAQEDIVNRLNVIASRVARAEDKRCA